MSEEISWYDSFWTYLQFTWRDLVQLGIDHALVVIVSVLLASVIGVCLGVATYRNDRARDLVLAVTGTFLTIPSLALFTLLIQLPLLGLGARSVVVALTMYGLLPIVRNTIVGLREVDPAVVESAQGMGMGRAKRLAVIELPLAWPVVLTGVRVSTLLLIGIAAIGAYINGPGLGDEIFTGLAQIGSATALNRVLSGTLGVIALAILFDLVYVAIFRLTIPKGIR
jgi:osmoprotectant transport system permease protein